MIENYISRRDAGLIKLWRTDDGSVCMYKKRFNQETGLAEQMEVEVIDIKQLNQEKIDLLKRIEQIGIVLNDCMLAPLIK